MEGTTILKSSEEKSTIIINVNGKKYELSVGSGYNDVKPSHTLSQTLRDTLGLTGTKIACNKGECGACTVLLEGRAVLSCMTLTVECDGKSITTIEGLEDPQTGALDPLQQAFMEGGASQCGFCTPGIIMSLKGLFNEMTSPTEQDIKEALSGHFCRCIAHYHVLDAVLKALRKKVR